MKTIYWVWEAEWVRVSEWGTANEPVTENYPYCSHARNKRRRLARGWTVIKKIHHSLTARYQRSRHLTPPTPYPSSFSPVVGDIFMTSNCSLSSSRCTLFLPLIHVKSDLCTWNSRVCFGLGCVPLLVFFRFFLLSFFTFCISFFLFSYFFFSCSCSLSPPPRDNRGKSCVSLELFTRVASPSSGRGGVRRVIMRLFLPPGACGGPLHASPVAGSRGRACVRAYHE